MDWYKSLDNKALNPENMQKNSQTFAGWAASPNVHLLKFHLWYQKSFSKEKPTWCLAWIQSEQILDAERSLCPILVYSPEDEPQLIAREGLTSWAKNPCVSVLIKDFAKQKYITHFVPLVTFEPVCLRAGDLSVSHNSWSCICGLLYTALQKRQSLLLQEILDAALWWFYFLFIITVPGPNLLCHVLNTPGTRHDIV